MEDEEKSHASFGRLLQTSKPERHILFVGVVALFFSVLSTLAFPYYLGSIIDNAADDEKSHGERRRALTSGIVQLLIIVLVGNVFTFIRGTAFTLAGERVVARMRRELYQAILAQETAFFDSQETGELMNRLSADTTVIQSACTVNISMGLRALASIVLSIILLFITSWKLTLVMMAVVPAIVVGAILFGRYVKTISRKYQDALAIAASASQQALSNIRTVRSFGAEKKEQLRYNGNIDETYQLGVKKAVGYGLFAGGTSTAGYIGIIGVLWYGGVQVVNGALTAGDLFSFLVYTITIAMSLAAVSSLFTEFMNAIGASERVFQLIDREPEIVNDVGIAPAHQMIGKIEISNVSFTYPARPDAPVLRDFSLTVNPRETVALVGQSGSGKSTVLALIQRLYDISEGSLRIDDVPVTELNSRYMRKYIGVVAQEPELFGGTIRENILYGSEAAYLAANGVVDEMPWRARRGDRRAAIPEELVPEEKLREVASMANCLTFIEEFPDKFDTLVGEKGVHLSGGQKQRVAIARALLCDPKILLLDEATSALDADSEYLVQQAIDRTMADRTVIIIAHRLSTVRDADRIVVMRHGEILGIGRHEELLKSNETYQQLVQRQLQGNGDGKKGISANRSSWQSFGWKSPSSDK
uniref:ATP-dependent transporter ycf16 n=1 Tax=Pinguiococcus pyrenoidosus TaxID=172671 RepID=A0A7R9UDB8_9STRA